MASQLEVSMSARALKFLDRWMAEHLPKVSTDDSGTIADLVVELLASAGRLRLNRCLPPQATG
ncbi:hypothetical protein A9K71_27285 [Mesorhizobium sp. WSM3873]|nr:hypothetical protein A9K71_27285 [Mesorhizobium sp. WSM3873]